MMVGSRNDSSGRRRNVWEIACPQNKRDERAPPRHCWNATFPCHRYSSAAKLSSISAVVACER